MAAPSTNDYARFFDESCEAYESNMDYNLMYLRSQQNLANDKLKANGYLFLSDVYDQLGIKRTKMSQIVGWVYKPEMATTSLISGFWRPTVKLRMVLTRKPF